MTGVVDRVVIDNGPVWLGYAVALGTIGATVFAGWATWLARRSVEAATELVSLERERDARAQEEVLWQHARRVSVEGGVYFAEPPDEAHDVMVIVLNASADPIFKCRLKMQVGDAVWGPMLVGTIAPGASVTAIARLTPGPDAASDLNCLARFTDVRGSEWVADARGALVLDTRSVDEWIAEGKAWGERSLSVAERGTLDGAASNALELLRVWRARIDASGLTSESSL